MPSYLTILGLILVILTITAFIGYSIITNKIIHSQEKEIAQLQTQIKRLEQREPIEPLANRHSPKFGNF